MNNSCSEEISSSEKIFMDLQQNYQDISEDFWEISNEIGSASFKKFVFKNIHVCFGALRLNSGKRLKFEFSCPIIKMHFSLKGSSIVEINESNNSLEFGSGHHNLLYYPKNGYSVNSSVEAHDMSSFHIVFTVDHFFKILNMNYPALDSFRKNIQSNNYSVLSLENMTISSEMNSILTDLIHCKRKGILKCLFTEAKILKLLMLQLEQFETMKHNVSKTITIKEYDIDKIYLVKTILEENLSKTLSLVELSRLVGLNDFKLKKGFKEIFGTTVFTYLTELRMREAKKLIIENEKSFAEISILCGYKFVQNFTKAFKTKFGTSPSEFRIKYKL